MADNAQACRKYTAAGRTDIGFNFHQSLIVFFIILNQRNVVLHSSHTALNASWLAMKTPRGF
jgi:hypothetical protein